MQEAFKFCSACGAQNNLSAQFCQSCGAKWTATTNQAARRPDEIARAAPSYVSISLDADGNFRGISLTVENETEAKLALKELKLKKKEFLLQKRQVKEQQRIIRAEYTQQIRARGSKMQGGGLFGRVVRGFQSASRDAARSRLASDLAPYERRQQYIEAVIAAIEKAILQLEAEMLRGF